MNQLDKTLAFQNPEGLDGLFTTVRVGTKWAKRALASPYLELGAVTENGIETIGTGKVIATYCGPLGHMSGFLLRQEHNPRCRTRAGLLQVLRRIYGGDVTAETEVTALLVQGEVTQGVDL